MCYNWCYLHVQSWLLCCSYFVSFCWNLKERPPLNDVLCYFTAWVANCSHQLREWKDHHSFTQNSIMNFSPSEERALFWVCREVCRRSDFWARPLVQLECFWLKMDALDWSVLIWSLWRPCVRENDAWWKVYADQWCNRLRTLILPI